MSLSLFRSFISDGFHFCWQIYHQIIDDRHWILVQIPSNYLRKWLPIWIKRKIKILFIDSMRFDFWLAVKIIQNGYELFLFVAASAAGAAARHCEYESSDYLFRKVRGLMRVWASCVTGSSNKRDLTQNISHMYKLFVFLGNVYAYLSVCVRRSEYNTHCPKRQYQFLSII